MNSNPLIQEGEALPKIAYTKEGIEFFPFEHEWRVPSLTRCRTLSFLKLETLVSERFLISFKRIMLWTLVNHGVNTACSRFDEMTAFIKFISGTKKTRKVEAISSNDFLNYRSALREERRYVLSGLGSSIRQWNSLGETGIEEDLIRLLSDLRLKGMVKGKAVSTMCPIKGPFTDIEIIALQEGISLGYKQGKVSLRSYALFWLIQALGARPIQIASMKVMDFKWQTLSDGSLYFFIDVPCAKQRGSLARDEFKKRKLTNQVGVLIRAYIEDLYDSNERAPLFPRIGKTSYPEIPRFEGHSNSYLLGNELSNAFKALTIISERTGEPIHINPYRFRYTLGTKVAEQGATELVIAELMGHADTQNVKVYVGMAPRMLERIDRAMAMQIAPIAQAFSGVIVNNEQDAIRGDDPKSRIVDPVISERLQPIGNCGKYGFCGLKAPVSCYTCSSFQPWLDVSHESMLSYLLSERERLMAEYGEKIASVNDRTIYAVAEVIQEIEKRRGLGKGE